MSKIYILGSVASGKTTLAKKMSYLMNIKYYELDNIVFDDKNNKRSKEEQLDIINEINEHDNWIIEGTYRKSCHSTLDYADKIILLDTPLWICKIRILTRFIKQKIYIEKCNYNANIKMLKSMYKWTNSFKKDRGELEEILSNYNEKLITLKNVRELIIYFFKGKIYIFPFLISIFAFK